MGAGRGGGQRARGVGGEWARRRREGCSKRNGREKLPLNLKNKQLTNVTS